ncbi:MAG: hypothetical protein MZU97_01185 [Bacillus subtilis]|nr:hypothetical protein [Bacillus subtilis]
MFFKAITQSLTFAFFSGVAVLVTSLMLAMLLNSKVKFIGVFRTIYFLPFIIPSFAVGAVYKNVFNPTTGLINQVLTLFGVAEPPLWYISPGVGARHDDLNQFVRVWRQDARLSFRACKASRHRFTKSLRWMALRRRANSSTLRCH